MHGTPAAPRTLAPLRVEFSGVERKDLTDLLIIAQQSALETAAMLHSRNPHSPTVEELKRIASRAVNLREKIGN